MVSFDIRRRDPGGGHSETLGFGLRLIKNVFLSLDISKQRALSRGSKETFQVGLFQLFVRECQKKINKCPTVRNSSSILTQIIIQTCLEYSTFVRKCQVIQNIFVFRARCWFHLRNCKHFSRFYRA